MWMVSAESLFGQSNLMNNSANSMMTQFWKVKISEGIQTETIHYHRNSNLEQFELVVVYLTPLRPPVPPQNNNPANEKGILNIQYI